MLQLDRGRTAVRVLCYSGTAVAQRLGAVLQWDRGSTAVKVLCYSGTAVAQWLRCCATIRKDAGSIPAGVIRIFH